RSSATAVNSKRHHPRRHLDRSSATVAAIETPPPPTSSRPKRKPPSPSSRPERSGVERPAVDLVFDSTEVRTKYGAPAARRLFFLLFISTGSAPWPPPSELKGAPSFSVE